jgi:hypothetical protein
MKHIATMGCMAVLWSGLAACDTSSAGAQGGAGGSGQTATGSLSSTTHGTQSSGSETTGTNPIGPTVALTVTPTTVTAGSNVSVAVHVTDFTLEAPSGGAAPGAGHYHVYFDDKPAYTAAWTPNLAIETKAGQEGVHSIHVVLVDGSHAALVPEAAATATFTVE